MHRRKIASLVMFYKIQFSIVAIPLPPLIIRPKRPRPGFPHQFRVPFCSTEAYMKSFFPRVVRHWNALPPSYRLSG